MLVDLRHCEVLGIYGGFVTHDPLHLLGRDVIHGAVHQLRYVI